MKRKAVADLDGDDTKNLLTNTDKNAAILYYVTSQTNYLQMQRMVLDILLFLTYLQPVSSVCQWIQFMKSSMCVNVVEKFQGKMIKIGHSQLVDGKNISQVLSANNL